MKNFLEYLSQKNYNIYENFGSDHQLSDDEINESFERFVNEGFWDFLTSFFQNLFGNTATDEEKRMGERIVRDADEEFGKAGQESLIKLIKKQYKKVEDFIDSVESERIVLLKSKEVENEKQSYLWACEALETGKGKFKKDEDKKAIDEQIAEYDKKSGGLWKKKKDDFDKDDDTDDTDNEIPKELSKKIQEACKKYESIVKKLSKECNTTPDKITFAVGTICKDNEDCLKLSNPKDFFALILMLCGGYLTNIDNKNPDKIIETFIALGVLSLKNNEN